MGSLLGNDYAGTGFVNSFKTNQTKLAFQRQLSKKVKFSSNWKKQKLKIQRLHSSYCQHSAAITFTRSQRLPTKPRDRH